MEFLTKGETVVTRMGLVCEVVEVVDNGRRGDLRWLNEHVPEEDRLLTGYPAGGCDPAYWPKGATV